MKIKDKSFRELLEQYIYLDACELAKQLEPFFANARQATGVLVYCQLDHEQGLRFEVLCCAEFTQSERSLQLFPGNSAQSISLPYSVACAAEAFVLAQDLPRLAEFREKAAHINAACAVCAELAKTRGITALDHLRHAARPDDVLAHLVRGEMVEKCYVRLEGTTEMKLYGTLVNEPKGEFGIHAGESLSFYLVKNEQGIMCLAMV